MTNKTLIKSVKVVNFDKIINCADVEIQNSQITKIEVKKGEGKKILIPGFIDTHIHGMMGYDIGTSTEELLKVSKYLAKNGVTGFMPTFLTEDITKLKEKLSTYSLLNNEGSKILGFHLEGPFISKVKKGAHDEHLIVEPNKKDILAITESANNMKIKMTFAPEVFTPELLDYALSLGIYMSVGHSNASLELAHSAFNQGANSVTHLWNAMSGVENRRPGIVTEVLLNKNVYAELICDFIHIDPETIKLTIQNKGVDKITVVTDAIRPAGLPDGKSISGGLAIEKKGALITLENTNTIAGSGATMLENFKNLLDLGYKLNEVVAMTSYNSAKYLDIKNIGQIKVKNKADLVLLDEKLDIEKVWIDGKLIS